MVAVFLCVDIANLLNQGPVFPRVDSYFIFTLINHVFILNAGPPKQSHREDTQRES